MKVNWGTGIVIGFIIFIGFILVMVYMMTMHEEYNYDLVTEEYYKKELEYQQEIDAEENVKSLSENIKLNRHPEGLEVIFPKEFLEKNISGTIFLYRPSNKKLDFEIPLELSNSKILIPKERLLGGRWNISIRWISDDRTFLFKDKLVY